MRRICSLLILLSACLTLLAQADNRNRIKYFNDCWLAQQGSDVWLTTLDLEWPQQLTSHNMPALQRCLSQKVFGFEAETMKASLAQWRRQTGQRITQMPDGVGIVRHYLNASTRIIWYEPNHYVSFQIDATETNQTGALVRRCHELLTYDIVGDRILTKDMVFHKTNLAGLYEPIYRIAFENELANNAVCSEADMAAIDLTQLPRDFALAGNRMLFGLGGRAEKNNYTYCTTEKLDNFSLLNRKFKKWLENDSKETKKASEPVNSLADKDFDIDGCDEESLEMPEQKAEYPGGLNELFAFAARNMIYPEETEISGRVVLSFVVEKDGSLSNLTVVRSLTTAFDREAVRLFRLMPKWQPAMHNGQPVRSRLTIPLLFRVDAPSAAIEGYTPE